MKLLSLKSTVAAGMITSALVMGIGFFSANKTVAQDAGTATSQWCKGVNIVFFPGGSPGGSFETVVYNGAVQATADLGATTQYVWSDWQPDKMVTQLQAAIATKPDGIAVMGHPGDEAYKPLVDQAEAAGIIVTAQNVQLTTLEAEYQGNGFGYAGATLYNQGMAVGNEAIKVYDLKSGDEVMVWGLLSQAGRGQRSQGVIDALKAADINVDYLEIDAATNADPTAGIPTFTAFVASHPDLKVVITDHGNLTSTLPALLQAAGKKPGDIGAGGFDLSGATIQGIKDGWIGFVNDQQEWLQGYLPILQICLTKVYGFSGLSIDTGAGFVTKDNVDALSALATAQIR